MKILVVNAGSSSLKYQLIDMTSEQVIAKGIAERIGQAKGTLQVKTSTAERITEPVIPNHTTAVKLVLDALVDAQIGVIKSMSEITAVGHRVLHAAEDFTGSALITPDALAKIESNIDLGPLHMPPNIDGIKACMAVMPKAKQVAVFDTTFHSTMPDYAYMYAIGYDLYKQHKIRKYGFHGTSHLFITSEIARLTGTTKGKYIICHLGNGCSISAVLDGKCIDTSMGLTPLEGLIMGTRSGDIDPAAIEYISAKTKMSLSETTNYLNKKSGMLGVSGVSSDFRDLTKSAEEGNKQSQLALAMFSYRIKKYVGSYAAALGGVDVLAFTAGVGENTPTVRQDVCSNMQFLGIDLDLNLNNTAPRGKITQLNTATSKAKIYIIPTNEELVIARETKRLI